MDTFTFTSPLLEKDVIIRQETTKEIGFKLYPGALILSAFLEAQHASGKLVDLVAPDTYVLEVGAGISGIGSMLLSAAGYNAICTDLPAILPLLTENLTRNKHAFERGEHGCEVLPLSWGESADVDAVLDEICTRRSGRIGLIIGADVVYHEHLIDPLLTTLTQLTEKHYAMCGTAPLVLLSYVQRFKRAKQFFKKAARYFDVESIPVAETVDYDCLTWVLPKVHSIVAPSAPLTYNSSTNSFAAYRSLVEKLPPVAADKPSAVSGAVSEHKRVVNAAGETDSDEEYRQNIGNIGVEEITTHADSVESSYGIPIVSPLPAAIYMLRLSASASGARGRGKRWNGE